MGKLLSFQLPHAQIAPTTAYKDAEPKRLQDADVGEYQTKCQMNQRLRPGSPV